MNHHIAIFENHLTNGSNRESLYCLHVFISCVGFPRLFFPTERNFTRLLYTSPFPIHPLCRLCTHDSPPLMRFSLPRSRMHILPSISPCFSFFPSHNCSLHPNFLHSGIAAPLRRRTHRRGRRPLGTRLPSSRAVLSSTTTDPAGPGDEASVAWP